MVVTLDGPAGAGKSTAARRLAERLGFDFLDTGALYRAAAYAAGRAGLSADHPDLPAFLGSVVILTAAGRTTIDGEDVSHALRTPEITAAVGAFADQPAVRNRLTDWQRAVGRRRNLVTEGRDQGTIVFPDALCKFFLTASEEIRAARRSEELQRAGRPVDLEEVLRAQRDRDRRDAERTIAPLKPAADALLIDTTPYPLDAVVDLLEDMVRGRMNDAGF
ncbi:MAG: (d)CMP kinase [Planctomycetia bacterium]